MPWIDELPAEIADTISDEYKTNPTLNKYNSMEELLKGTINASSLLGNAIRVPGEDAGETDKQEFYQKLMDKAPNLMLKPDFADPNQSEEFWRTIGKPDEVSKYDMPEEVNLPDEVKAEMQQIAFETDMTKAQFKKWSLGMNQRHQQTADTQQNQYETEMSALKNEWGLTIDERLAAAKQINDQFHAGRDFDSLPPSEKKALYETSVAMTGKGAQGPDQPAPVSGMTPQEAREQADEIMRKLHDSKNDMSHAEKMGLVNKRIKLLQKYDPKYANDD